MNTLLILKRIMGQAPIVQSKRQLWKNITSVRPFENSAEISSFVILAVVLLTSAISHIPLQSYMSLNDTSSLMFNAISHIVIRKLSFI
jgi:hypothetical protein